MGGIRLAPDAAALSSQYGYRADVIAIPQSAIPQIAARLISAAQLLQDFGQLIGFDQHFAGLRAF